MRTDVAASKSWTDALLPRVKQVIANYLIVEAPFEEDARHGTDLIVLTLEAKRIAVRLREQRYASRYGDEFTLRSSRPSGVQTELAKVISGWGDYFFYGFADDEDPFGLSRWLLGDLKVFRLWFSEELGQKARPRRWDVRENRDGSSKFHAFRVTDLPEEFVIARYAGGALCPGSASMTSSRFTARWTACRMLHTAFTPRRSSGAHGTSQTVSCPRKTSTA